MDLCAITWPAASSSCAGRGASASAVTALGTAEQRSVGCKDVAPRRSAPRTATSRKVSARSASSAPTHEGRRAARSAATGGGAAGLRATGPGRADSSPAGMSGRRTCERRSPVPCNSSPRRCLRDPLPARRRAGPDARAAIKARQRGLRRRDHFLHSSAPRGPHPSPTPTGCAWPCGDAAGMLIPRFS